MRYLLLCAYSLLACSVSPAATIAVDINPTAKTKLVGTIAQPAVYKGKSALKVEFKSGDDGESLVILPEIDFADGAIDYDFAGNVQPGSPPEYRGFTGLAFRSSADGRRYECFYQRPLNSHSADVLQRSHTVQYMSLPGFLWRTLRENFPGKYEAWADIEPGEWAHARIEVKGTSARIFINQVPKPALEVEQLKQGITHGTLALWVGVGTVAFFANVKITP